MAASMRPCCQSWPPRPPAPAVRNAGPAPTKPFGKNRCIPIRVFPKIGVFPPKMDGENNVKSLLKWDDLDLGVPLFSETSIPILRG